MLGARSEVSKIDTSDCVKYSERKSSGSFQQSTKEFSLPGITELMISKNNLSFCRRFGEGAMSTSLIIRYYMGTGTSKDSSGTNSVASDTQ